MMVLICGIDEAGRGPILGPLVMCGFVIDENEEKEIAKLNVRDSKLLSREKREEIFEKIRKADHKYEVAVVRPDEIDKAVNGDDGLNLNKLEAKKSAEIINALQPDKAFIDSPGNNVELYKSHLKSFLKDDKTQLVVEHKADMKYKVVSAASIIAKVTRDNEIEKIKKGIGVDFGSGYMSDPKTVEFLENYYEKHGHLFRKSWLPYQSVMNKKFQKKLEDFSQFVEEAEHKNKNLMEKLKMLEDFGYRFMPTSTEHEHVRMKGNCTITLYKNGKLLVQGKEKHKKSVEKILGG